MSGYRSTEDAAQAFLEGDARQQDDAARYLDALLPSPVSYDRLPLPDVVTWDTLRAAAARVPGPVLCSHRNAVTEYRESRTAYQRRREVSGRLRLRRCRSVPFHVLRCPDCRMWAGQVEIPGLVSDLRLPPCLLPTTGTTPDDCNGGAPCP